MTEKGTSIAAALYSVKCQGRNRLEIAESEVV
jgi:hypothetical protein